eukprot:8378150-Pyramimonas_sp.AAC.1
MALQSLWAILGAVRHLRSFSQIASKAVEIRAFEAWGRACRGKHGGGGRGTEEEGGGVGSR